MPDSAAAPPLNSFFCRSSTGREPVLIFPQEPASKRFDQRGSLPRLPTSMLLFPLMRKKRALKSGAMLLVAVVFLMGQ
jgi:hypothetical protein